MSGYQGQRALKTFHKEKQDTFRDWKPGWHGKSQQNSRKLKFSGALSFKTLKKIKHGILLKIRVLVISVGVKIFFRYTVQKYYLPNTLSQIPAGGYSPKFKRPRKRNI